MRKIGSKSFSQIKDVTCIEILSKSLTIGSGAFSFCKKLTAVTFPNADHIKYESYSMTSTPDEMKIMVKKEAILEGEGLDECVSKISYIEKETASRRNSDDNDHLSELENENSNLKKYASYLKSHLRKDEKVVSFNDFMNASDEYDTEDEEEPERHPFVGPDDEEFHQVVSKIGEGGTRDVYKIIDERTGEAICKKVMKECREEAAFKTLKNSLKELEAGMNIRHPCICEAIGYSTHERLPEVGTKNQQKKKTTIALFFELLPFSVEDVIKKGLLSNTLKVRIAVEVAFGMSHLHSLGMIHRDLKLGNIMMNSVFDSKIIDFGLVHISDISMTESSMTKGIGTLAYMSPEMVNEEDYDNKTDVYSYGIVLFKLFSERLPKQSMRDRMNNVPMGYPTESDEISKYRIRLIRRCTKFEAERRPTFDDIIDDLFSHNFGLAPEVDVKVITQRFNIIRKRNSKRKRSKIK